MAMATAKEMATTTQQPMGDGVGEIQQSASRWGGGAAVGAAATTTTTVGTAPLPTTDCSATTMDNGSDCGGSWDHGDAKTTDVVVTDGQSEDDDPREGDRHTTGAVYALEWLTTTMHEQTLASALASMVIACHPLPKRRRITGPSRDLRRKSSDESAEGGTEINL